MEQYTVREETDRFERVEVAAGSRKQAASSAIKKMRESEPHKHHLAIRAVEVTDESGESAWVERTTKWVVRDDT
jgi:hypothetical protein